MPTESDRSIKEADLQATIVQAAELLGWWVYHPYDSRRSEPGWPDLVLVHPFRGMIYAELKIESKNPTPVQHQVLTLLARWSSSVYVWRPSNLDDVLLLLGGSTAALRTLEPTRVSPEPVDG